METEVMKSPCRYCENRSPTCHAECAAYLEFHAWKRTQYAENLKDGIASDYQVKEILKAKRGK